MAAYVVIETQVTAPGTYEDYKAIASGVVAAYGGRYLARGGAMDVLEGDWTPSRLVILEFPSLDAARRFYDSPEYAKAREVRAGAATLRMVAVEGT